MILRALKWLITPQPRRLAEISRDARGPEEQIKPELGMEAIDMDHVTATMRRNQSLEQSTGFWGKRHWTTASVMPRTFQDDDAGYARKFHKTFQKGNPDNDS